MADSSGVQLDLTGLSSLTPAVEKAVSVDIGEGGWIPADREGSSEERIAPQNGQREPAHKEQAKTSGSEPDAGAAPFDEASLAPMMRNYLELKRQYPEPLLLYQVGDFYEVFFEDAKTVSEALNIRLTSRDRNNPNPVPMCGVPIHAIENYLSRLVNGGFSCVLVSQVEDGKPGDKGKNVRREISRIITPGVRFEGDGLDQKQYNYLASVLFGFHGSAVSFVDVSTGHLRVQEFEFFEDLLETVERIRPAEIILPSTLSSVPVDRSERWVRDLRKLSASLGAQLAFRPFYESDAAGLEKRLRPLLSSPLSGDTAQQLSREAVTAIGAILDYVDEVACGKPPKLSLFRIEDRKKSVFIDAATRRNLELSQARIDGDRKNSLLSHIDYARTAMGSRLLSEWVLMPSSDMAEIRGRLDAVEQLLAQRETLDNIRSWLVAVRDIDRILSRVTSFRANPKDLTALAESLEVLPGITALHESFSSEILRTITGEMDPLTDVCDRLKRALADDPPSKINEGGIFRDGYNADLDELRAIRHDGHAWLTKLEQSERAKSGIPSLKVRYNNVFGYFIEVSNAHLGKVPAEYERKQTLANAERFVTRELKEFELKILSAKGRQIELERELFVELRAWTAENAGRIQQTSRRLSELDVLCAFAELAARHGYCRPEFIDGIVYQVNGGRHPVVERVLGEHNFVPNDTILDGASRRFAVLTGPNMGGKSTYLRQVGLIQLMAQAGSYVPAGSARLSLVDRIFTRIGAADDLTRGDSTFMVEMKEASVIVKKATERSLVLIDEIGRGTATADGLAIAAAVAEWLLERVRCRTIFATHFHELTELAEKKEGAFCLSVGVLEHGETIEFTHRIEEKAGDRSYGIEVAKLAGLPDALISRAQEVLASETSGNGHALPEAVFQKPQRDVVRDEKWEIVTEVLREFAGVDPNQMTPVNALLYLSKLKRMFEPVMARQNED